MERLNLMVKVLSVGFLITAAVVVFANRAKAYPYGSNSVMVSMDDHSKNMDGTKMDNKNAEDHGYVICPVCHMKFKITKDTPWTVYKDKTYYFDSEEMKKEFLKDPEKYIKDMPMEEEQQKPELHEHKSM